MGNAVRKRELSSQAAAAATMPAKPAKTAAATTKKKRGAKGAVPAAQPRQPRLQPDQLPPPPDPEEHAYAHLRRTLREDFEAFLLNNLLLSVRFFENYDSEIQQLRNAPLSESEARCNSLLYQHERHCVWPDVLQEHVAKRVAFKPKHGPNKNCTEALCSRRIIVVHSNVTAVDGSESITGYNRPSAYKLAVESSQSQGYVKLRSINTPNRQRRVSYDVIDSAKSEESIYAEHNDALIAESNRNDIRNHTITPPPFQPSVPLEAAQEEISETSRSHDESAALSPGKQVLQDLEKRIEGFTNVSTDVKPEFSHVTPKLQVTETTKLGYQRVLGPQNPEQVSSEVENRPSARRPSGTGRPLQYHLLPTINLKPAKSLSDLDHIGQKTNRTRLSPPSSESSGYKSMSPHRSNPSSRGSESDYGYTTITELKTPRPLNTRRLGHMPEESCGIPSECFMSLKVRTIQIGTYDDEDDSDSGSDGIYSKSHNPQQRSRKLYDEHYYLNSTMYMASFADVFVERISETLGFTAENVELAEMQGDKIYCDTIKNVTEKTKMKIRMHITPSIHCKTWPVQALEWQLRNRDTILDRSQNLKYTWPTREMIRNVRQMGYHIFPIGYTPTHGSNKESHIEWQIAFPEAENYLEQYLSHPQIFCYLFTLALEKNFLEPLVKSELKLLPVHIRSVLFWECEKNYAIWKEDRLGESLLRLLRAIYDCLKRRRLPDYFLRTHNKFESVPGRNLSKIQEKLHSIMENPVKYALITARNLYYISKDEDTFYPEFAFEKLDEIISAENYAKLLNPLLAQPSKSTKINTEEDTSEEEDDEGYDLERQWHKDAHRDIEAKKAARRITKAPKTSAESINVLIPPQKNDPMRSKLVLELFIPHFIEMANYSNKYRAYQQAIFYLKHAERLTRLLAEQPTANKSDTEMLMSQIKSAQQATIASERYSMKLLRPPSKPPNESSTDKSPTFTRRQTSQEITIVDVHQTPKRVVSIEIPVEVNDSSDL